MTIHQFKKGLPVILWDTSRENPKKSIITSDAEVMKEDNIHRQEKSDDWCKLYAFECTVEGCLEKTPIEQLDPVSPGSLLSASLKGLPNAEEEFKKQTKKFFNDNGINVTIETSTF